MLEIADTRRRLLPYKLTVAEAASAAALDGVVDVVVVAEGEGALHEEEDGERVERRDERDGQRVAAALTAGADTVAAHHGVRPRRDLRVGRHLGMQTGAPPTRARRVSDATNRMLQCWQFNSNWYRGRTIPASIHGWLCFLFELEALGPHWAYIFGGSACTPHICTHITYTRIRESIRCQKAEFTV